MAEIVIMPKQGQSVESCIITSWHKKLGDAVKIGEVLFTYETDKATFEEEAKVEGSLLSILIKEGDDVPCLDPVCIIGSEDEDISGLIADSGEETPEIKEAQPEKKSDVLAPVTTKEDNSSDRTFISPRAVSAAQRQGVDSKSATPTGPHGRIIERDIYTLSAQSAPEIKEQVVEQADIQPAVAEYTDEKLSNVRKVIAKNMHLSLSTMAQLTHNVSFDATKILAMRKRFKESGQEMGLDGITINDMILYAVSRVLKNHPALNAYFLDDKMRYFHNVNLGIAVDTERGLLVPTLNHAEQKSLSELSKDAKQLIKSAQSGNINPELLTNGTFTVTNLGSLGVESFTPVINPPQTAILGVCTTVNRLKASGEVYPAMGLSLTYDHRAVDGAPASRFLKELCDSLANYDILLAR